MYADPGAALPPGTAAIREGLSRVLQELQDGSLLDSMGPAEIVHPRMQIVSHPDEEIFTLAAVPDDLAESLSCELVLAGHSPPPVPPEPSYGRYYQTALELRTPGARPSVLVLLWTRTAAGHWQIVSYHITES